MTRLDPSTIRKRAEQAYRRISPCTLCPHACGVLRNKGETGRCRVDQSILVSSVMPHHGEEHCLSGLCGSGTLFVAGCNLDCIYCQNYDLSQMVDGRSLSPEKLASSMVYLQEIGCHNLNWVTPTHVIPQLLEGLALAVEEGFQLPIVYNSGGYDDCETLQLLEGIVDIYMPDFKYWDPDVAEQLSNARDYPAVARAAIKEMHRQVGDLVLDSRGLAVRGLLVRHLVLPNGMAGTPRVMQFLVDEISPDTYVNVMGQYRPCYQAATCEAINRPLHHREYLEARTLAQQAGLHRFA